jgi:hypothetical protein
MLLHQSINGGIQRSSNQKQALSLSLSVEQLALPCHQPNPPSCVTKPLRTKVTNPGPRFCRLTRRNDVRDQSSEHSPTPQSNGGRTKQSNLQRSFKERLSSKTLTIIIIIITTIPPSLSLSRMNRIQARKWKGKSKVSEERENGGGSIKKAREALARERAPPQATPPPSPRSASLLTPRCNGTLSSFFVALPSAPSYPIYNEDTAITEDTATHAPSISLFLPPCFSLTHQGREEGTAPGTPARARPPIMRTRRGVCYSCHTEEPHRRKRRRTAAAEGPSPAGCAGDMLDELPDDLVVSILADVAATAGSPADLAGAMLTYVLLLVGVAWAEEWTGMVL